jgi:opacity protein-like surface antigen
MTRLARVFAGFAAIAALASAADEQTAPWHYRVELFGNAGAGRLNHGSRNWGRGADYGFGIGVRPFSGALNGLGFEVQTAKLTDEKGSAVLSSSLDTRFVAVNALYHFRGRTRFQPYLLGGYGRITADYYTRCTECVFDVDPVTGALTPRLVEERTRAAKAGVTFGAGMKIAVHRRFSIRPELFLLDTTPGTGWNFGRFRFQVGAGLHF